MGCKADYKYYLKKDVERLKNKLGVEKESLNKMRIESEINRRERRIKKSVNHNAFADMDFLDI